MQMLLAHTHLTSLHIPSQELLGWLFSKATAGVVVSSVVTQQVTSYTLSWQRVRDPQNTLDKVGNRPAKAWTRLFLRV